MDSLPHSRVSGWQLPWGSHSRRGPWFPGWVPSISAQQHRLSHSTCDPVHAPVRLPPGWRVADGAPVSLSGFAFKQPHCAAPDVITIGGSGTPGSRHCENAISGCSGPRTSPQVLVEQGTRPRRASLGQVATVLPLGHTRERRPESRQREGGRLDSLPCADLTECFNSRQASAVCRVLSSQF